MSIEAPTKLAAQEAAEMSRIGRMWCLMIETIEAHLENVISAICISRKPLWAQPGLRRGFASRSLECLACRAQQMFRIGGVSWKTRRAHTGSATAIGV